MTNRCEPPEHLRGRYQLCWLGRNDERITVHWVPGWDGGWVSDCRTPREMGRAGWRYIAPVVTPEEVAALRAEVMRAGAECSDMGNEIARLRAEVASLRVTLGQQPPTEGVEPVGCPLPGMCVMVHDNATIRARVAQLEAALRKIANSGIETFAINVIGGDDISVEGSNRFAHERDVAAIMATARAALEEKP